jgi:hypothetical protein
MRGSTAPRYAFRLVPMRAIDCSELATLSTQPAPLPRLKLHGLRHTWATLALREGIDIHVVNDRLGPATSTSPARSTPTPPAPCSPTRQPRRGEDPSSRLKCLSSDLVRPDQRQQPRSTSQDVVRIDRSCSADRNPASRISPEGVTLTSTRFGTRDGLNSRYRSVKCTNR